jgi:hypothetical protein
LDDPTDIVTPALVAAGPDIIVDQQGMPSAIPIEEVESFKYREAANS